MGVHDSQDPQFLAHRQLIMDKVHRPHIVWSHGRLTVFPQLGFHAAFRMFVAQLKAQLIVNTTGLLHVDHPAFAAQQHVNAPVAIAHTGLADFLDPSFDGSLISAAGLVVKRGAVKPEGPTGRPDLHPPNRCTSREPAHASEQASELSPNDVLQHLTVQCQIGHDLLELIVLIF